MFVFKTARPDNNKYFYNKQKIATLIKNCYVILACF